MFDKEIKRAVRHGFSWLSGALAVVGVSSAQVDGLQSAVLPILSSVVSYAVAYAWSRAQSKLPFLKD